MADNDASSFDDDLSFDDIKKMESETRMGKRHTGTPIEKEKQPSKTSDVSRETLVDFDIPSDIGDLSLGDISFGDDVLALAGAMNASNHTKVDLINKLIGDNDRKLADRLIKKIREDGAESVSDEYIREMAARVNDAKRAEEDHAAELFEEKMQHEEALKEQESKKAQKTAGSKDARVEITISEDAMYAVGTLYPPSGAGARLSEGMIERALKDSGVKFGQKHEYFPTFVAEVAQTNKPMEDVTLAEGKYPEEGHAGDVIELVEFAENPAIYEYKAKGLSVPEEEDYRYAVIDAGTALIQVIPSTDGKDGKNVLGEPISSLAVPPVHFIAKNNIAYETNEEGFAVCKARISGKAFLYKTYIEARQCHEGEYSIHVSRDMMTAKLDIYPPVGDGAPTSEREILLALSNMNIIKGIDEEAIKNAVEACAKTREPQHNIIIAKGEPPEHGRDGWLEVMAKKIEIGKYMATKRIRYKDFINNLISVAQGQLLAVHHCAEDAKKDGADIYGRVILAEPGKPINVSPQTNVLAKDVPELNDVKYFAQIAGQFTVTDDYRMNVAPLYTVKGNVDMKVGNIYFQGDVTIKGSVEDDFVVEAEGSITIEGNVGCARVIAKGDILVGNGIITKNRGIVEARGNVHAKFIEYSVVKAGNDISVEQSILGSDLTAGNAVRAVGDKGVIVGGVVRAQENVTATFIGNDAGARTEILVGLDFEADTEFEQLNADIAKYNAYYDELNKLITRIKRQVPDPAQLPLKPRTVYNDAVKKFAQVKFHLETLRVRELEVRSKMDLSHNATISALRKIYPDVRLGIGKTFTDVHNPKAMETFFLNPTTRRIDYRTYKIAGHV